MYLSLNVLHLYELSYFIFKEGKGKNMQIFLGKSPFMKVSVKNATRHQTDRVKLATINLDRFHVRYFTDILMAIL